MDPLDEEEYRLCNSVSTSSDDRELEEASSEDYCDRRDKAETYEGYLPGRVE